MKAIEVSHLDKEYQYFEKEEGLKGSLRALFHRENKSRTAVSDFSFFMETGEFLGLMGPNGAGKTTLIKILTGIIHPTFGSATVLGHSPSRREDAFKKKIAVVMGQKSQLWWDLPAADSLLLNKAIYGISEERYRKNVKYYTEIFDVTKYLNVPVRKLSLGERMKFEIIASLIHDPQMLFMDEPTIGLDAVAQRQIREMLRLAGKERGISLLLTSHYTEDLLELTPRVIVIREGQQVYDGCLNTLLRRYSTKHTISVQFSTETSVPFIPWGEIVEQSPYRMSLQTDNDKVQDSLRLLLSLGNIEDIRVKDDDVTLLVERVYQGI